MYELKYRKDYSSSNVLNISCYKQLENRLFNVASGLDKFAETTPGAVAFIESSKSGLKIITFKELQHLVNTKSQFLNSSGIKKNDVVLVLQPQSLELFVSILAVLKIGGTVMFVDPSMDKKTLNYSINEVAPKAAILTFKSMLLSALYKSIRSIPIKIIDESWLYSLDSTDNKLSKCEVMTEPVKTSHNALITFTSGSSGTPKAIARSHGFLKTQLDILSTELKITKNQIELTGLPMFVLANIASGVTTVLSKANLSAPAKASGKTMIEESIQSGTTSLLGSPSLIDNIVSKAVHSNSKLPHIKKVLTGGGTVSLSLLEKIETVCPNASIVTVYGSSEAEPICHQTFQQTADQDKAITNSGGGILVGLPVNSIDLKILELKNNNKFNQAICQHIKNLHQNTNLIFGEILVNGDHVVKQYYKNIGDSSNKVLIEGKIWHRTNDTGYIDSSGRLWLTGAKPRGDIDTTYSFCIEQALESIIGDYYQSAFVAANKKRSLYISRSKKLTALENQSLLKTLSWAGLTDIQIVNSLPVDNRHNTKVLYDRLK